MSKTLDKDEVVEIIVEETKHTKEEIEDMIKRTIEMMDNMVNEDGAAYVVANNLGVNISMKTTVQAFKIKDLVPGQSNVSLVGRIRRIYSTRTFNRKDGTEGKVRNLEITDETGQAKITLWDNKTMIVEDSKLAINQIVKIAGVSTKIGYNDSIELSLSSHGSIDQITKSEDPIPEIQRAEKVLIDNIIEKMKEVSIEAKIIDRQGIVEFDKEKGSGKVTSLKVQDKTGTVRVVFWNENCDLTQKFNNGDIVYFADLRTGMNKFGNIELTFNDYSEMKLSTDQSSLEEITIQDDIVVEFLQDLKPDMQRVQLKGSIIQIGELRTFSRDNKSNQVVNITLMDKTRSIRVSLWGSKANYVNELKPHDIVEITNGTTKISDFSKELEVSLGNNGDLKILKQVDNPENYLYPENQLFNQITNKMIGIDIKIQIQRLFEIKDIQRQDGSMSQVINMSIIDIEGNVGKLAAWDKNIEKIENVLEGEALYLKLVNVQPGKEPYGPEITVTNSSVIEKIDAADLFPLIQTADKLQNQNYYVNTKLNDLSEGLNVRVTGNIVKTFKPSFYNSCPSCNKKVTADPDAVKGECVDHGSVTIELKMILTLIIDDGFDTCMIKLFNNTAEKLLSMKATEANDLITRLSDDLAPFKKQEIEMAEIWLEGKVIKDQNENININTQKMGFISDKELKNETLKILDQLES